jgi:glycosyltransferase involved in cell wall biosynthesis
MEPIRSKSAMKLKQVQYPAIKPVPMEISRPLWSVMIPTYNGAQYLEQTLRSLLDQAPTPDQMQIEVIDDCSPEVDTESLVKEVGQGRVAFYRQPQNVGLVNNWNACIQRSRGHWVHVLHQDDLVLPGFYHQLEKANRASSSVGAAFCRYTYMDEDGLWKGLSHIERREAGILENWIEKIAILQLIQFPSIVVKRSVYEKLGGFSPEVHYASDWEMWKRIAAHYDVWFEPHVLACYREHSTSETSRLVQSGKDIADARKAIQFSEAYLPSGKVHSLTRQAREYYALYALGTAKKMLAKNELSVATVQIQEALKCSRSFKVIRALLRILGAFGKNQLLHTYLGAR